MTEMNIPTNLDKYELIEWGPKIQEWINKEYGDDKFRLVCYGEQDKTIPIWIAQGSWEKPRLVYIAYYQSSGHFYPIANISAFIGIKTGRAQFNYELPCIP